MSSATMSSSRSLASPPSRFLSARLSASVARMLAVVRWEMRTFFFRPTTYVLLMGTTLLAAWSFAWLVTLLARGAPPLRRGDDPIAQFLGPNVFLIGAVSLIVPLLTMNLVADERRRGLWELLATAPLDFTELVLGKLLAAWSQFLLCIAPWPACLFALRFWNGGIRWIWNVIPWFDGPGVDFDTGPVLAAGIALALIGLTFTALGLCFSSMSRRALSAALSTGCCLALLFLLSLLPRFLAHWQFSPTTVSCAEAVSVWGHLDQFSRGIVSPQIVAGHLSTAFVLFAVSVSSCRRGNP